jgi:queuine/archaeosine tRNA-ribosyltransferase
VADIFIAYSSKNETIAKKLHDCLKHQWDIVYDYYTVGDFADYIEKEINISKCLIAIFSENSKESIFFRDELSLAQDQNIPILGLKIDGSDNPIGFRSISCCNFSGWDGDQTFADLRKLKARISKVVPPKSSPERPIHISNGKVPLPILFQSVSSFETQLPTDEAIEALDIFKFPSILVSTYDLEKREEYNPKNFIKNLITFKENGGIILLDSGSYEKCRNNNKSWNREKFHELLKKIPYDLIFCFDEYDLKQDVPELVAEIIESVAKDQLQTSVPVLPIIHARTNYNGEYLFDSLPELVFEVTKRLSPPLIAIPERELGDGLLERIKNITKIRALLNNFAYYQPIHILGTGDPIVIPFFIAAGADSFDGLEWCRKVVDRDQHRLHHFHHFDLFAYQAECADSPITRNAINQAEVKFIAKVIFHNLDFYTDFICKLRTSTINGNIRGFITENLPKPIWSELMNKLNGILKI